MIKNNFWLKYWRNYYFIFMSSRDMNFIMLSYSEKCMQSLLIPIEILSSACAFNLTFFGITKAKCPNKASFSKLNAYCIGLPMTSYT